MKRATASLPVGTWVSSVIVLSHFFQVKLGVNLSGFEACMAQKFLNGPKVGAPFQKVDGVGVPQHVWTDMVADSGVTGGLGKDIERPLTRKNPPAIRNEDGRERALDQ